MDIQTDSNKKYGILLSGGLDSAVLLYLLIRSNSNINLQPFTIPKFDGAALYADPIIDHFNQKFELKVPKTKLVGDPTAFHRTQSRTAIIDIFENYTIDHLFVGINQNPPELADHPFAPVRDRVSTDPRIVFPFVDLYKDDILRLMYKYDQHDLVDLTHTCTEQQQGRCNICWQCSERKWAFKQLGQEDTGVM